MKPATTCPSFHESNPCEEFQYYPLGRTDMHVPRIGVGGCSFGGVWVEKEKSSAEETLIYSLKRGLNYIDTAPWYGNRESERVIGQAMRNVPRSAYYIATKVGRYEPEPVEKIFDFSYGATMSSIEKSLALLGVEVIDLCQVHDPEFAPSADIVLNGCMKALDDAKRAGKIRYIGVTGYPFTRQRELLAGAKQRGIDVVSSLTYARIALHDKSGVEWLREISSPTTSVGGGVAAINASCMGMGMHTPQGPPAWFKFAPGDLLETSKRMRTLAAERGVDIAKLALARSVAMAQSVRVPSFLPSHSSATVPVSSGGADGTGVGGADGLLVAPMTLTSCLSPSIVESNIVNSRAGALTRAEEELSSMMEGEFEQLPQQHWEGAEPTKYWAKLKSAEETPAEEDGDA